MDLTDEQRDLLLAVIDRIIPPERFPAASHAGVLDYLQRQLDGDCKELAEPLAQWLKWLINESYAVFGQDFVTLHAGTRDELLDRIESANIRSDWDVEPTQFFGRLIELVAAALSEVPPAQTKAPGNNPGGDEI